jgi:hypothetical protein
MNGRQAAFIFLWLFLGRRSSVLALDRWAVLFPSTYPKPSDKMNLKKPTGFPDSIYRKDLAQS